MKPIPGYPGHTWEITARDTEGRATKVRFARHRAGPIDCQIRKRPGCDGTATWMVRYTLEGRDVWKTVSPDAPPPWTPEGLAAALRNALDELHAAAAGGDRYATLRNATAARARLTLGTLAADWINAGLALPDGTPRSPIRQGRLRPFLDAALEYWADRDPAAIGLRQIKDFAAWRRTQPQRPGASGDRSTDLQLVALSNLCQWGLTEERLKANPFAGRPRFRKSDQVRHCPEDMPHDATELHRIAAWLFGDPATATSGAWLLFQAMTGLRPGEPGGLRRGADMVAGRYQPGARYQARTVGPDGRPVVVSKLAIGRTKRGINPAVIIHTALADFLAAWDRYSLQRWPGSPWLFPDPCSPERPLAEFGDSKSSALSRDLTAAVAALGLPRRRPHAMRAYYVRVRLSQGVGYAQIADELGERTGASIIKSVYAFGDDCLGDGRFDWIPADGKAPAWTLLKAEAAPSVLQFPATQIATLGRSDEMPSKVGGDVAFDTGTGADTVAQLIAAQSAPRASA